MSVMYRRTIPVIMTFVIAVFIIVSYFFAVPPVVADAADTLTRFGTALAAWAIGIGTLSFIVWNLRRAWFRDTKEWYFNLIAAGVAIVLSILGFALPGGVDNEWYKLWYNKTAGGQYAVIVGLAGLLMMAGYFTAVRLRGLESAILVIGAILGLIYYIPLLESIWPGFNPIGAWVYAVPQTAGMRGLTISFAIGMTAVGLRSITGREKGVLGGA
jgi:hypothetical protein